MTRSIWKGPFVHPSLLKKIDKLKDGQNKNPIKTNNWVTIFLTKLRPKIFMIKKSK